MGHQSKQRGSKKQSSKNQAVDQKKKHKKQQKAAAWLGWPGGAAYSYNFVYIHFQYFRNNKSFFLLNTYTKQSLSLCSLSVTIIIQAHAKQKHTAYDENPLSSIIQRQSESMLVVVVGQQQHVHDYTCCLKISILLTSQ